MIDAESLEQDLHDEQARLEALIQRSVEQKKDIRDTKRELQRLKQDIEEEEGVRRNGAAADS